VEGLLEHKRAGSALAAEGDWLSAAAVLPASGELVADDCRHAAPKASEGRKMVAFRT
jgi:hypothetical protein